MLSLGHLFLTFFHLFVIFSYLWVIISHLLIFIHMDIFLVGAECEIGALLGTVLETLIGTALA